MGALNLTLTPKRTLLLHSPIVVVADDLFFTRRPFRTVSQQKDT